MFVRRGLVRKNIYKQYVPNMETLKVFIEWMVLYDKVMHDKDFPKSNPFLTPGDREKIRFEIV